MFTQYESTEQLIADWVKAGKPYGNFSDEDNGEQLVRSIRNGDESLVPRAEKLLEEIEASFPETLVKQFMPHVFGPVISVPDYLAGTPTPFRHQKDTETIAAPLKLVVC